MNTDDLLAQIRGQAVSVHSDEQCGVYFLLLEGEIVYVGQSVRPQKRIQVHIEEGKKQFDSYSVLPTVDYELNELEAFYILTLLPRYNQVVPVNERYLSTRQLMKEAGAEWKRLHVFIRKHKFKPYPFGVYLYYNVEEIRNAGMLR